MKAERCQATAASGKLCSATPRPGRPWCLWHDPEAAEQRRELSRKGGVARSNRARARATLGAPLAPAEVQAILGRVLKDVVGGKIEPGVATAAAGVARALIAVREATEVEERLAALEAAAGIEERKRA